MENLLYRLERLYTSRTKAERDLILRLRFNNVKNSSSLELIETLDELRIRIDEIEMHVPIGYIETLKIKLGINDKL